MTWTCFYWMLLDQETSDQPLNRWKAYRKLKASDAFGQAHGMFETHDPVDVRKAEDLIRREIQKILYTS